MLSQLSEFHFLRPWCLLAILPALALLYSFKRRQSAYRHWLEVCDAELLPHLLQHEARAPNRRQLWLNSLAVLSVILALAGPTWQRLPAPVYRNQSALVIALNLSQSMQATDIQPSRLLQARYKIADLLAKRKDGQTALLVYSGAVFTVTPLTTDIATIASQLEALTPDIMPSEGNLPEQAINKAIALLRQSGFAKGDILLVTDSLESEPKPDLQTYRLSVLAVATEQGAPIPSAGGGFLKDQQGGIVLTQLTAKSLQQLARQGNGRYQLITANDKDIENLSALFNQPVLDDDLSKTAGNQAQWIELGPWLLLWVLVWAALQFRQGLWMILLMVLIIPRPGHAFDWQSLWKTDDQRAVQAFKLENYPQAAQQFNNPEWKAAAQFRAGAYQEAAETLKNSQTADAHYNRGNALAKTGELSAAIDAYQRTLQLEPEHEDAKYNKALVEKALQQQQQSSDQQGDHQDAAETAKPDDKSGAKSQSDATKQPQSDPDQAKKLQILKQIPDQPSVLLKRKFQYMYNQSR